MVFSFLLRICAMCKKKAAQVSESVDISYVGGESVTRHSTPTHGTLKGGTVV